jgi:hypothetical protein
MTYKKRLTTFMRKSIALLIFSLTFCFSAFAQSGTSTISGTVLDQQGAAVPGATVRITNPATNFTRTVTTGPDGTYSFPSIPPATYRLEVEASNFKKAVNTNVQALVDRTVQANVTLEAGEITAVVDVTTGSMESIVNTQDASLGNTFVPRQITELPTNLRRVTDLMTLQPGVTREGYVAGARSDQSNITLDGIDINDQQTGGRTSQFQTTQGSALRLTTEAVEEFRITTANPNANQGRSSGAQISLVTKSGTNDLRGSIFYFNRPTRFSANNFFNNAAGVYTATDAYVLAGFAQPGDQKVPRPQLTRQVYGGSLGGPIKKDRAFFFYSYEGQRERTEVSVVRVVPLAHLGRGELRYFGRAPGDPAGTSRLVTVTLAELNAIFPSVGINPAAMAVLAEAARKYPANDASVGDQINTGGFRFNAPTAVDENTHILRLDFNLKSNQSLFLRGNYQHDKSLLSSYFPDTAPREFWDHPIGVAVGHNWTISSNKINNFRYGLTRQAFTSGGDSTENAIIFRFVFQPSFFQRTVHRVTPVHNFTNDFTWIKGSHTMQFGGNVRIIRNQRVDFGSSFDTAVVNPSFYASSGRVLDRPFLNTGYVYNSGQRSIVQNAAAALIGRFSQYTGRFNYDISGNVLPVGRGIERTFATEEYDVYGQDIWKPFPNLTLTYGLRYGLSRPVYETEGYQAVPDRRLGDYFEERVRSAATGVPYNELIQFTLGGPKYDKPGFYSMDWNNLQPSIAVAWSPNFKNRFLRTLFGGENQSTIRGGFRVVNDYFGQQLAVTFNQLSTLGFTTEDTIAANTYNVTSNPGPRFTRFNQTIRTLPNIEAPNRFMTPADEDQRIETSLDATLVSPIHYTWSLTYGRELPKGMYAEASYIGRAGRNLLASRDIMALNNLIDPQTGVDWYTAAGRLHDLRASNTPLSSIPRIPYFENLFPNLGANFWGDPSLSSTQSVYLLVAREGVGGFDILDWTFVQLLIDDLGYRPNMFFHPQYAAFSAFSTVAKSDYHGATFSLRQRLGNTLSYDINYTFSTSKDNASGLQTASSYGSAFILNPLRPDDNYSYSDFDVRHVLNANFIFQLPFGEGRRFFSNANPAVDAILGGWQLSGIFRYNSALPLFSPFDAVQWATNWNVQSYGTRIRPLQASINRNTQNVFQDPKAAYQSFRNARPGETGERNVLRGDKYMTLDMGLSKSFRMPWSENHKLQLRWEVFNVFNHQFFEADNFTRSTYGLEQDSDIGTAPADFGKIFTSIKGTPRRMQFGLRYSF